MLLWYSAIMLVFEASSVINARMGKIALGNANPSEFQLMFTEKIGAAFEASGIFARGGDTSEVIDNYRKHVAANALRLGTPQKPEATAGATEFDVQHDAPAG